MKLICFALFAFSATLSVANEVVRYDNHTLYRFVPKHIDEVNTLMELQNSNLEGYDFWTYPKSVGVSVDILVSPDKKKHMNEIINSINIDYEVLMENIQEGIDKEAKLNEAKLRNSKYGQIWNNYQRLDVIYEWLATLSFRYPRIVTLIDGGRSFEGRQILGVKVSFQPGNERKGVWLDSLIHSREWISGATVTFILNELLTSVDPAVREVAENHDWYIFPVLNPDGYEFTHTNNRLWRKTRRPYGIICVGADPNRNWGYRWNTGGASDNACSELYAGPSAFSEVETESLSNYIRTIGHNLKAMISFHSYSQLLLIPYGHTVEHLDNYYEVFNLGQKAAESLSKRYGTRYTVGNGAELLYVVTGASDDWAKATFQIPIVLTYELRDQGNQGFLLPADQIIPSGLETLDSLVTLLKESNHLFSNTTIF